MVAPSCARRTRLCGFLLTALTTRLLCAPEQVLGAAPGATAPRASSDAVGFTTEDGDGDDGVEELAAGLGGLQLGDNVGEEQPEFYAGTDGSGHRMVECKHPGLTKLERCVGIVNSGHGDAKWMEKPKPSWFAKFPEEIFPNVMAFTGVDVRVGGGAGQIARLLHSNWSLRGRSPFVRWSAYLEQYANSEQTGEVVQFVPGRGGVLPLPPSYVVRFPLPALPWSVASALEWGASPFFVHGTDVDENAGDNPGEEQVPPGGWRLTRRGAERLPAGQNELLLEVPYDQLYVDVAAQNGQNPFVAGVAEALRYE
eukprot:g15950.t1